MLSDGSFHRTALDVHGSGKERKKEWECVKRVAGSCKQSENRRGLSTRQGEEGRVDRDDDGELLLVVKGH